jgi:hypothetical protein
MTFLNKISCCFIPLLAAVLLTQAIRARAQSAASEPLPESKVHIGLGIGMDFGGMGIKVEYLPIKYVGVFGGLGYNFYAFGFNGGVHLRPLPDKKIQPLVLAMYGYNGVINIEGSNNQLAAAGLEGVNKTYYGFTTGLAGELKVGRKGNRLYLGVLYPFRNETFRQNYDKVLNSNRVTVKQELLPVTFSFGFNWAM